LLHSRGGIQPFRKFYLRRLLRIFPLYYLALFVVLAIVPYLAGKPAGVRGVLIYAAVCIGIAFAVAYLSWHLYEKQFLKLKSRFA